MKTMNYLSFGILLILALSPAAQAAVIPLNFTLSGLNEVPSNASTATGTLVGTYDDGTDTLAYTVNFSGLSAVSTAAHFHAPAPAFQNGPVTIVPAGFPAGVTSGTYVNSHILTATQENQLLTGLMYFNIHTVAFPGGEIRSQLLPDNIPPFVTAPAPFTASQGDVVTLAATYGDSQDPNPSISWVTPFGNFTGNNIPVTIPLNAALGTYPPAGIPITVIITDASQNSASAVTSFTVTAANPAVPEPSTFVLAGLGLVGLGCIALRKKYRRPDRSATM